MNAETEARIFDQTTKIIKQVLKNSSLKLDKNSTPSDVEGWDSLKHALIIKTIEDQFQISFSFDELFEMKTLGDIVGQIQKHLHD